MKHRLAILLVLAMLLCIFVGCRTEGSDNTLEKDPPAAAGTAATDTAIDYSEIKIGLLLNSTLSDGAWSQAVGQSLLRLQEELGLSDDQIVIVEGLTGGGIECDSTIAQLVDEGCNIIFTTSWGYMETTAEMAEEYPDNGQFQPAGIISMFEDEEEQRQAAELFHTTLPELSTKQERERAFHDILVSVKRNSYQYYMAQLGTDVNAVKKAVEGKKALEELQRARISLE